MRAQHLLRWVSAVLMIMFVLLALDSLDVIGRYQSFGGAAIAPASTLLSGIAGGTSGVWSTISSIGQLNGENQQLRADNARLQAQNLQLEAMGRENVALRQLLGFAQSHAALSYHPATIIARGPDNFQQTLTLDQGGSDGIQVGMAVVDAAGVVGRVSRVGAHIAVVLPIDSPAIEFAAYVNSGAAEPTGIVTSQPGVGIVLTDVQATAPLREGDWVMTSGLGGTFPRDLPIGRIRQIRQRPVDMFQVAVLDAAADLQNDQSVLIVTGYAQPAPAKS